MAYDARERTITWITTYDTPANITKDDDVTEASYILQYSNPPYPLSRIYFDPKNVDLTFTTDEPTTEAIVDWDGYTIGYNEKVPIHINCPTKQGITGNKLLWKAQAELRRIFETYPLGSYRGFSVGSPYTQKLGLFTLYGVTVTVSYERDTS